jgi:hypothetical protein
MVSQTVNKDGATNPCSRIRLSNQPPYRVVRAGFEFLVSRSYGGTAAAAAAAVAAEKRRLIRFSQPHPLTKLAVKISHQVSVGESKISRRGHLTSNTQTIGGDFRL